MLAKIYQNIILKKPGLILVLLLSCLCFFGYFSKNFRLDASSETLLIEGDPDLKYLNEINERYGAKEFLVLTYTPKESICLLYTSPSPRDRTRSRMPSSA